MGWFDDIDAYEQGGFTGGGYSAGDIQAPQAAPAEPAAPQPAAPMTREQYRDAWQGSGARSMSDLQAFLSKNGGSVVSGNGTVRTPYGEDIDMLQGARTNGNGSAAWGGVGGPSAPSGGAMAAMMPSQAPSGFSGSAGGYGGLSAGGSSGANLSMTGGTWDGQKYTATPLTYGGDYHPENIATPGAYTSERFNAPADFRATTAEDMQADPGYQFRMAQGAEALQASRAASGMLRSGNTLTALNDYAQGMGSQEFANVDARRKGEYQQAYGNALGANQANNQTAAQAYGLTNQYQGAANQFNAARQDQARQNNFANKFTVDNANNANAQNAWSGNVNAQ
ncbi:MAG: hypothetical protein H0X44_05140, partial [Acidobacteria bacterium]|nr:hypothetical protein [Acidobacteriota bacterium]